MVHQWGPGMQSGVRVCTNVRNHAPSVQVQSATDAMTAVGIPVVDSYQFSEGMTGTSLDGSHYVNHVTVSPYHTPKFCLRWRGYRGM